MFWKAAGRKRLLAITVAEKGRQGGWRRCGTLNSPPGAGMAILGVGRSISSARPEEFAVVPAHHGEAGARQADDCVTQRRSLPGFGSDAAWIEERFGDGPIAGAGEPAVERTQGRDQTIERDESELPAFEAGRPP